ncbi:MAG: SIS domain-containing protein [Verrucomicrobia bacterium]|nr:SIS domain-containing protein [Verrucomicrobiota bacterium]
MNPSRSYLEKCRGLLDAVAAQDQEIQQAADWFAETILAGRMAPGFGSGHSCIMVEEMWPRYGSFPGFNPIVELSLSFNNLVVGVNGLAARLTAAGQPPKVLSGAAVVGPERAVELVESAYDEHARRLAKLYENMGAPADV